MPKVAFALEFADLVTSSSGGSGVAYIVAICGANLGVPSKLFGSAEFSPFVLSSDGDTLSEGYPRPFGV